MKYISTNKNSPPVTLKQAVLQGLAPDGGLYLPVNIPVMEKSFWNEIKNMTFEEIAYEVAKKFIEDEISEKDLKKIIKEAINFDAPIRKVYENIYSLELFHGPTLAFKDFGARFMARLFAHFTKDEKRKTYILTATSGDTGSAVGNGFLNIPGFEVIILYPSGKISQTQEKQLTTFGNNITALEVSGTFDDCQNLVKTAFQDTELNKKITLSSANSINIARLIPQTFYYFYAFSQLKAPQAQIIFSVPTGNLGNLTAGIIASKMGLPVEKFIAAQNINDTFHQYLKTGNFTPKKSTLTMSNAMDVGNPSNFARLKNIATDEICAYTITDQETKETMQKTVEKYNYLLDPHGAVGLASLEKYYKENPGKSTIGIFLETAHPAKFFETVESTINRKIEIPQNLVTALAKKKVSILMKNNFDELKQFLLNQSKC